MFNILSPQLDNSEDDLNTKKDFWPKGGFRTFPKVILLYLFYILFSINFFFFFNRNIPLQMG